MKTFCLALALTVIVTALLADVTAPIYWDKYPVLPPWRLLLHLLEMCVIPAAFYDQMLKMATCCLQSRSRSGFGYSAICKPLGLRGEECYGGSN
uniref:Putative secreted protein n=1 Tax=Ixodes ricinus TaxID=34613 RepID=A0A090X808_IXORI